MHPAPLDELRHDETGATGCTGEGVTGSFLVALRLSGVKCIAFPASTFWRRLSGVIFPASTFQRSLFGVVFPASSFQLRLVYAGGSQGQQCGGRGDGRKRGGGQEITPDQRRGDSTTAPLALDPLAWSSPVESRGVPGRERTVNLHSSKSLWLSIFGYGPGKRDPTRGLCAN